MSESRRQHRPRAVSEFVFYSTFGGIAAMYVLLILGMLAAAATFTTPGELARSLARGEVQYSLKLSLLTCSLASIFSVWVAVPTAYLLSRCRVPWQPLLEAILDIPIVLPPLVIGLFLLILFQTPVGTVLEGGYEALTRWILGKSVGVTYEIPAIVLSQFMVACAFAVRTMHVAYDQIDPRPEQVALTLGCNSSQAFWRVLLPQSGRGIVAAGSLAWARSLGEFGPILIFAGATRFKTEVLPTTVFLELTVGNLEGAVAASLVLVGLGMLVLMVSRTLGLHGMALS